MRKRRGRPPEGQRGGFPAVAVALVVLALAAGLGWLVQTGGSPLRSRRLSSLTDYRGLVVVFESPYGGGNAEGLAEPETPCRVLEKITRLGTSCYRVEVEAIPLTDKTIRESIAIGVNMGLKAGNNPTAQVQALLQAPRRTVVGWTIRVAEE